MHYVQCHSAVENATRMTAEKVKQAMQPLLLTAFVTRLGVYSAKKFYLSVLYNLTIWIAYCYFYYYIVAMFKIGKIFLLISIGNMISFLSSILITGGVHYHEFVSRQGISDISNQSNPLTRN